MEKDEYRKHFELEESHWWFAGRRAIIEHTLRGLPLSPSEAKILDAGCGTGMNLVTYEKLGKTFGLDFEAEALRYCQRRGLKRLVRGDVQKFPFPDRTFDLVFLLDVISHESIGSDVGVLQDVHRILKRGGLVVLSDSALNFLWSRHDRAFHIRKRYVAREIVQKMDLAGFRVEKSTYFNFFLFFPIAVFRFADKLWRGEDHPVSHLNKVNEGLNCLLSRIFQAEAPLLRNIRFPFGCSLLCVGKKI